MKRGLNDSAPPGRDAGQGKRPRGIGPGHPHRWWWGGIRARVALAMVLVLGAVAPAFVLALYYSAQMQTSLRRLAEVESPLAWTGVRIAMNIRIALQEEHEFLRSGLPRALERQAAALAEIEGLLDSGERVAAPDDSHLREARRRLEDYRVAALTLPSLHLAGERQRNSTLEHLQQTGEALAAEGRAMAEEAWQRASQTRTQSLQAASYAQRNLLVALAVGVLLTLYLMLSMPGRIVGPLRRLLHALQQAAQGDYSVGSLPRSHDEIGELSVGIERLLATFKQFDSLKAEKIREMGTRFRLLAEGVKLPVAWVDQDLIIRYCNPAFAEAVGALSDGASVGAALGPDSLEPMLQLMLRGRDPGDLPPVEPISPAAEPRRFHAKAQPIRDSKGDPVGFLISLRSAMEATNAP
ncbi:MAG: HAMP domain-containing protein [Acidobacteria bacterium]|nr:HAMP domain-containing protein [Acidobacteriota bacterium]